MCRKLYGHWEKEGILLLEDLGDTALWDRVQGLAGRRNRRLVSKSDR